MKAACARTKERWPDAAREQAENDCRIINEAMNLRSSARWYAAVPDELFFQQVWDIHDDELSSIGQSSNEPIYAEGSSLSDSGIHAAKQSAAIAEFQDLQDLPIPAKGPFFNVNYFYFEGLSALREAVVAGLNGQIHASLAVLRSALELILLHAFWKQERQAAGSFDQFYEWLRGQTSAPSTSKLLRALYSTNNPLSCSPVEESVRSTYAQLCSYAHKPVISEAVTALRGGNMAEASAELLQWWLAVLGDAQRIMLDVLVRSGPASLFPIDLVRKFGFSPPVGVFFDSSNCFALEAALGSSLYRDYQQVLSGADPPATQLEWVRARPDLTDEEIRESWAEDEPWDQRASFEVGVHHGYTLIKAKMRALGMWYAYAASSPSLPDLSAVFKAALKEDSG